MRRAKKEPQRVVTLGKILANKENTIKILFKIGNFNFEAELNNTITAQNIIKKLPLESTVGRAGQDVFFEIDLQPITENATLEVKTGDVAFCPQGKRLYVFLDSAPAMGVNRLLQEEPVVVIGAALTFVEELKQVKAGEKAFVSLIEQPPVEKKNDDYGSRKLTQSEIDVLVQQLLAEKNKSHG